MNAPFKPAIWTLAPDEGNGESFLVCENRLIRGQAKTIPGGVSYQWLRHLVAIRLGAPCVVVWNLRDSQKKWNVEPVSVFGLSLASAEAALKEVWRSVSAKTSGFPNVSLNAEISPDKMFSYKGGTPSRNLSACLGWNNWDRENLSIAERVQMLRAMGFKCSEKALVRFKEERGL